MRRVGKISGCFCNREKIERLSISVLVLVGVLVMPGLALAGDTSVAETDSGTTAWMLTLNRTAIRASSKLGTKTG